MSKITKKEKDTLNKLYINLLLDDNAYFLKLLYNENNYSNSNKKVKKNAEWTAYVFGEQESDLYDIHKILKVKINRDSHDEYPQKVLMGIDYIKEYVALTHKHPNLLILDLFKYNFIKLKQKGGYSLGQRFLHIVKHPFLKNLLTKEYKQKIIILISNALIDNYKKLIRTDFKHEKFKKTTLIWERQALFIIEKNPKYIESLWKILEIKPIPPYKPTSCVVEIKKVDAIGKKKLKDYRKFALKYLKNLYKKPNLLIIDFANNNLIK
jgi:hypothetical protein